MSNPNKHIDDFLEYFYKFPSAPEYAVLIKGAWGSGKTWFIEKSLKMLEKDGGKSLYVSLNGVTNVKEIEDAFFIQLHPVLSSKGMKLGGKLLKGLAKATIKFDLDDDGKADGSTSVSIPDIDIPEYLTDTEGFVLVFDDLERCSINIEDMLGYINHFVEHQGFKVIVIANEDEIPHREDKKSYIEIKEKLIGETFEVKPDLEEALESFIARVTTPAVNQFYTNRKDLISRLYLSSGYNNLRHLRQALWGFERLFNHLSVEIQKKDQLLADLFWYYLVYSFEIKSGNLSPAKLKPKIKDCPISKLSGKYPSQSYVSFFMPVIELELWEDIFNKGIINDELINSSLMDSHYFQDDMLPDWKKIWEYRDLSDKEFEELFRKVESQYHNMKDTDLGIIKHITGTLMRFSEMGVYDKEKNEILIFAKSYIDTLKDKNELSDEEADHHRRNESYGGYLYMGVDIEEFQIFCNYIDEQTYQVRIESYPEKGLELLKKLPENVEVFVNSLLASQNGIYFDTPILSFIDPEIFIEMLLSIPPSERRFIYKLFKDRYSYPLDKKQFDEELDWLKSIKILLTEKQKKLKGKISGYFVGTLINTHIDKAIELLGSVNAEAKE